MCNNFITSAREGDREYCVKKQCERQILNIFLMASDSFVTTKCACVFSLHYLLILGAQSTSP